MDKNVLDKEENYMKIEHKSSVTFKDLNIGDIFKSAECTTIDNTYMKVKLECDNPHNSRIIINAVRLNDGELMCMSDYIHVCPYKATLTIEHKK